MKFCQNCGVEINESAVVCITCGCSIKSERHTIGVNDRTNIWLIILAIFVPVFGIIYWFYPGSPRKSAKVYLMAAIVSTIVSMLIIAMLPLLFMFV